VRFLMNTAILIIALMTTSIASTRVAVLDFRNNGPTDMSYMQSGIADMLITTLAQSKNLDVVERAQLDKLVKEMSLGSSGLIDPAGAAQLGKGAGAQWVVIGSFMPMGKAVRIDAKVVAVETGIVIPNGTTSAKAASVETLDEAVDKLSAELLKKLTGEMAQAKSIEGDPARKGVLEVTVVSQDLSALGIDGQSMQPEQGTMRVVKEIGHGTHVVQVFKGYFPPKEIFKTDLLVPGGYRVRTKWENGQLVVLETIPLKKPETEAPVQTSAPSQQEVPENPAAPVPSTDAVIFPSDFQELVQAIQEEPIEENKVNILHDQPVDPAARSVPEQAAKGPCEATRHTKAGGQAVEVGSRSPRGFEPEQGVRIRGIKLRRCARPLRLQEEPWATARGRIRGSLRLARRHRWRGFLPRAPRLRRAWKPR